nr:ABC transporter permease [Anaerolineae bacterium]
MVVILRRAGIAFFTLLIVMTLTFFLIRKVPGDPLYMWAMELVQTHGMDFESAYEQVKLLYDYDPNEPLGQQYVRYLKGLMRGNLGTSMVYKISTNKIIIKALPWTVFVLSTSLLISFGLGSLMGMVIAWKRKTALDPIVTAYAALTGATPDYITALILLVVFAINLKLFPMKGAYDSALTPGFNWPFIKSVLHHAILPISAYVFENTAAWAMAMKGSAVSVLGEDYIMAARARGLKERRIMVFYMGRNAVLPLVTSLAIALGAMLGGATFIETIFSYPGIGWFFGQATTRMDFGLMQGLFLVTAAATILSNLLADILYSRLDPRIKLEE